MIQRSRFARLSIQLNHINQNQINKDIDADTSINVETKQFLKHVVEQNNQQHDDSYDCYNPIQKTSCNTSPSKLKRGSSLIHLQNLEIMRIQEASNEGYLKLSGFESQKQFEERKSQLIKAVKQTEKIDMKEPFIQNLACGIAVKAIKTYNEAQFMLRIFTENTIFSQYSQVIKKNVNLVNLMRYKFYPKNSIIYETGDFGQYYYFLLSGKLLQLLPISDEIVSSPVKISAQKTPIKMELNLLNMIKQNDSLLGKSPKMTKNLSLKEKRNSFSLINNSMSILMEKEFEKLVPHHKFNQYILPGQGFGDSELFSKLRRGCTIFCEEDSHLIIIQKEDFQQFMGNEKSDLVSQKINFLNQFDFLESIPNSKLNQILETSITLNLNSKNIIYQEGQDCESIYFIRKGEVTLTQILETSQSQEEQRDQIAYDYDGESDLYTAMNKRKKKQERVPILIISENSYFGEYEILKKIPQRTTQAICSSQESEIIEIKISNLLPLVKVFGKYANLKQHEKVRDKFMEERLQLIQSQKREQNISRQAQQLAIQDNNALNNFQMKRKSSLQLSQSKTLSNQNSQYQSPSSNISNSDLFPLRSKTKTLNQIDRGKQNFSFSKLIQTPSQSQIKIEEYSKSNNTSPSSLNITKSERVIGACSIFSPNQKIRRQLYDKQKTLNHQQSSFYDFSIKDSKNQIIEEIQQKQLNQNKQNSLQLILDQQQNHADQKEQKRSQDFYQIQQLGQINTPKQIKKQNLQFHKKCKSSTYIPIQQTKESLETNLQSLKNEFKLNLFENYLEKAEKQVQQKQEVMQRLTQNVNKLAGNSNKGLFDEEFQKGFNKMYLRKFGKKYEKN
ncbi:cyclic nucleotide-binding domain protein (macronuclear) [Tetrahymena thermophila SB210]|uniref:Cyclic nucleotide-binding domain protein n=1 Tax=Tetrahymena thermophila (strain SB210) TaxID=312017 RepID=Q245E3_TETTS|nr:cyclic nucleotide-binding domain protein [Tetrahymena thermophila SB210]EAS03421.2 cyclic nucleotide-binding domain protein [Tetrahymena thermophila SB210]|eukprot:XP_001023666.2 cyclic nucleotide-binding domain protein [Tetrahymena thermophila SB210]